MGSLRACPCAIGHVIQQGRTRKKRYDSGDILHVTQTAMDDFPGVTDAKHTHVRWNEEEIEYRP